MSNEPRPDDITERNRARVLEATLEGIADVGWANLTIADIVRRARVSKRTFYELYTTKHDCLFALYEAVATENLDALDKASALVPDPNDRVEAGTAFYLARLQSRPQVVRTLVLEILHSGDEGLVIRRRVMRRFAEFLHREINASGCEPPVPMEIATLIVGGINELTLEALEANRMDRLTDLVAPIARLIRNVIGNHAQA